MRKKRSRLEILCSNITTIPVCVPPDVVVVHVSKSKKADVVWDSAVKTITITPVSEYGKIDITIVDEDKFGGVHMTKLPVVIVPDKTPHVVSVTAESKDD